MMMRKCFNLITPLKRITLHVKMGMFYTQLCFQKGLIKIFKICVKNDLAQRTLLGLVDLRSTN